MSRVTCICENCGATYEKELNQCPYCGHMNEQSAEKDYREKLEKVQKQTKDLSDSMDKAYGKEMAVQGKKIWKLFLGIGIVILAFGILYGACELAFDNYGPDDAEQILWQKQNFPILDELYEKEEFDAIYDFLNENYQYDIWQWKHAEWYYFYVNYKYIIEGYARYQENPNEISKKSKIYLFEECIHNLYFIREDNLTNQDLIYVHAWQEEIGQYFYGMYDISESDIVQMLPAFTTDYGGMDYDAVEKYAKKVAFK